MSQVICQVWRDVVVCRNWPVMRVPQFITLRRNAYKISYESPIIYKYIHIRMHEHVHIHPRHNQNPGTQTSVPIPFLSHLLPECITYLSPPSMSRGLHLKHTQGVIFVHQLHLGHIHIQTSPDICISAPLRSHLTCMQIMMLHLSYIQVLGLISQLYPGHVSPHPGPEISVSTKSRSILLAPTPDICV